MSRGFAVDDEQGDDMLMIEAGCSLPALVVHAGRRPARLPGMGVGHYPPCRRFVPEVRYRFERSPRAVAALSVRTYPHIDMEV
jgi:hypothetical protein